MNPLRHPKTNAELGKPQGWDEAAQGPCMALPVVRGTLPDGMPRIDSFWKPTDAELKALNEGGAVNLAVFAKSHPVVWVGAISHTGKLVDQDAPVIIV